MPGLKPETRSTMIIIALPEGSVKWINSNDAETQQFPIKLNTDYEQSFCCVCVSVSLGSEQKSD